MLLEVPLSMMAWISVVIVQAIVHFGYFGNRQRDEDGEQSVDTFELDNGEPPLEDFEELLSQTGDEVINCIRSNSFIERRAREQLEREKED